MHHFISSETSFDRVYNKKGKFDLKVFSIQKKNKSYATCGDYFENSFAHSTSYHEDKKKKIEVRDRKTRVFLYLDLFVDYLLSDSSSESVESSESSSVSSSSSLSLLSLKFSSFRSFSNFLL